jgi:hypothetical protein
MAKLWKFVPILIVAAVCLGLTMVPGAPPAKVASAATLNCGFEVEPDMTEVGYNENFAVNITVIDTVAQDMFGWDMYLTFDADLVAVTGVDTPATLPAPNNAAPSVNPRPPDEKPAGLLPWWNNTTGVVHHGYTREALTADVSSGFVFCTIHFRSKAVAGTSYLNFDVKDPAHMAGIIDIDGAHHLNWSMVVNGTVRVGGPPTISVSPKALTFDAIEGEANPSDQTLELCNLLGVSTLDWSLTDNAGWLSETPTSGSLGEGDCEDVTVSVDITGMEAGDYSAAVTVTGSAVLEVPVSLHIEAVAPVMPGNLSASSLSITPQQVEPGQEVTISVNVVNTGGETGSYDAILYINGVVEDSQSVSVAAGTSKNVIFTVSKSEAGVYDVSLAGQSGQFEVVGGGQVDGGGLSTGGIIAIVVIVIVLVVGLFLIRRGTRRET